MSTPPNVLPWMEAARRLFAHKLSMTLLRRQITEEQAQFITELAAESFVAHAPADKEGDAVRELRECIRELLAVNDMDGVSDAELLDAEENGFAPEIRQQAAAIRKARALAGEGGEGNDL